MEMKKGSAHILNHSYFDNNTSNLCWRTFHQNVSHLLNDLSLEVFGQITLNVCGSDVRTGDDIVAWTFCLYTI